MTGSNDHHPMNARCAALLLMLIALCVTGAGHASAFYSPGTGRWLSKDPIEESGGSNLYAFVYNRPTMMIDRFGLTPTLPGPVAPTQPMPVPGIPGTPDGPPLSPTVPVLNPVAVGVGVFFGLTGTLNPGEDTLLDFYRDAQSAANDRDKSCCCECVTSLRIKNVQSISPPFLGGYNGNYGHRLTVEIGLEYLHGPTSGSAHLEWQESTNKPTFGGGAIMPNQPADLASFTPPSPVFAPWYTRRPNCPGVSMIDVTDTPVAPISAMPRHINFRITVHSGCDSCPNKSLTVTARQDLTPPNHIWSDPSMSFQ